MKEIWKDIPNYEGLYQVSNLGRVMSLHSYGGNSSRIMKPCGNGTGYLKVMLCKNLQQKQYLVHRLVAMAFIPNPNNYDFVNHKDENKMNNCVENLEWCTKSYNSIYYLNKDKRRKEEYASRLRDKETGELSSPAVKHIPRKYFQKVVQKDKDGNVLNVFDNASKAAEKLELYVGNIVAACKANKETERTKKRTCKGYIWEFLEE